MSKPQITVIPFSNPANFTFDNSKVNIIDDIAKLKLIGDPGQVLSYDFLNEFIVSEKLEFNSGTLRQKDLTPANEIFYSGFKTNFDGDRGEGNLAGTIVGSPVITSGKAVLVEGTDQYIDYLNLDLGSSAQKGCIRAKLTPNWEGSSADYQFLIGLYKEVGVDANGVYAYLSPSGFITVVLKDNANGTIVSANVGPYSWTKDVETEIEINWNLTDGETRLFIGGEQVGATMTATGTRSSDIDIIRIGRNIGSKLGSPNFHIRDLQVFNTDQHTSNYTPESVAEYKYCAVDITVPALEYEGIGEISSIDNITMTGVNKPTQASAINQSQIDVTLSFSDSNESLQDISGISIEYSGEKYPTDNPTIIPNTPLHMTELIGFFADEDKEGLDEIKYQIEYLGEYYWIGAGGVEISDKTYEQANTLLEIQASLNKKPIDIAPDSPVKIIIRPHSETGITTPSVKSLTIDYGYNYVAAETSKCLVFGEVTDNSGEPISGVMIEIDSQEDYMYGNVFVSRRTVIHPDSQGRWAVNLIETESTGRKIDITYHYKDDPDRKRITPKVFSGLTIKNIQEEGIGSIIKRSESV